MINWRELLQKGRKYLSDAGCEDSEFDALQLILTFFDGDNSKYFLESSEIITETAYEEYFALLRRRAEKVPLQYIIGTWDFYKNRFIVGEGVLIPRAETEELVDSVIRLIKKNGYKTVYDLCTGSGCIGLSIAAECPDANCYLFDLYDAALSYTHKNLFNLGLSNVKIIKHDVLTEYTSDIENADIIVSNPPYIESRDMENLQPEVLKEPHTALDGGDDGLIFYRAIKENWSKKLNSGGMFAFECGEEQNLLIENILLPEFISYSESDIYSVPRFVFGKKL